MDDADPARHGAADDTTRRAELADFLRARRAAVTPEQVGLRAGGRRRTPGLRREEVAELADVGLSWYTWLEQGRSITPSPPVLDAIARALLMTPSQHEHLHRLAAPTPAHVTTGTVVDDHLAAMVTGLAPHAAYVLDERFDVVAHNAPAELVMHDLLTAPAHDRNLLLWLFRARSGWTGLEDRWARTARANLLDFRTVHDEHPTEPRFAALLADLAATGEPFRSWWAEHDVLVLEPEAKIFPHPELGPLRMLQLQSRPVHAPWLRLRILIPDDEATRTALARRHG